MHRQRNIVHICNNFISSKVHARLISSVDCQSGVTQDVYVPVRRLSDIGVNAFGSSSVGVTYDYCLPAFIKFFPLLKVLWVSYRFYMRMYRRRGGVVVAHSLWSDGFPAFLCSKIFGGSYSVFIRGTDLNFFLPKLPHYRLIFWLIVRFSDNVFFVSPAHRSEFRRRYPNIFKAAKKEVILPNGVDSFWLENKIEKQLPRSDLLFVGRFDKNKNIAMVIKVYEEYVKIHPSAKLRLVGGDVKALIELGIEVLPPGVEVLGKVNAFEPLQELYRTSAVLLVPSISETFGLVYIEALTQGCPVVHTKGQGVSGYFDTCDYVYASDCRDVDDLTRGVLFLTDRYPMGVPAECVNSKLERFSWSCISFAFVREIFGGLS